MKTRWMLIILVIAAIAAGCSDTNTARVTIVIGDQDIAKAEAPSLIDRFLGLFSTKAEAYTGWPGTHDTTNVDLKLTIQASDLDPIEVFLPTDTSTYSTELQPGSQRTFTLTCQTKSSNDPPSYLNYVGSTTIDLAPGDDVSVVVYMIPVTSITDAYLSSGIELLWDNVSGTGVTGYNIYRSTSYDGPYAMVGNAEGVSTSNYIDNFSPVMDTTYYYRVSVTSIHGEGQLSTPYARLYNP
jgi:hypothetical protein